MIRYYRKEYFDYIEKFYENTIKNKYKNSSMEIFKYDYINIFINNTKITFYTDSISFMFTNISTIIKCIGYNYLTISFHNNSLEHILDFIEDYGDYNFFEELPSHNIFVKYFEVCRIIGRYDYIIYRFIHQNKYVDYLFIKKL